MKNKGFTLVEMLAVISVLGVVSIFLIPAMLNAFGTARKEISKEQEKIVLDAAKMYITDIDLGVTSYKLPKDAVINDISYQAGDSITGYDFKKYVIDNNGINVDVKTLVELGLYDKNCKYKGTVLGDGKVLEKDLNCVLPGDCTINLKIDFEETSNHYYKTKSYIAEVTDSCKK